MKIAALFVGACIAVAASGAMADPGKPLDTDKLKTTNVYILIPQDQTFIEAVTGPRVQVIPVGPDALSLEPDALVSSIIADAIIDAGAVSAAQTPAYPLHYWLDGYDMRPVLQDGADAAIKSLGWLHPLRTAMFKDADTGHAQLESMNAGADSILTVQLYYSMTPDYRGVVLAALVKIYSSALSPDKYSPYDPDSKYRWLKQTVARRTCLYQSKLIDLPAKTPEVVAQMTVAADKEFDAAKLKKEMAAVNADPYGNIYSLSDRSAVHSRATRYDALMKGIQAPGWTGPDARLMMSLLWSAGDGAPYKQALQQAAAALGSLIDRSLGALPADASVVAKDSNGKPLFYQVTGDPERKILIAPGAAVVSMAKDDPVDIGNIFTE